MSNSSTKWSPGTRGELALVQPGLVFHFNHSLRCLIRNAIAVSDQPLPTAEEVRATCEEERRALAGSKRGRDGVPVPAASPCSLLGIGCWQKIDVPKLCKYLDEWHTAPEWKENENQCARSQRRRFVDGMSLIQQICVYKSWRANAGAFL